MLMAKLVSVLAVAFISVAAQADEEITYKDVAVSVMDVYVPTTIKADQNAFVVVNGMFPNSCYSYSGAEVKSTGDFTHQIRTIATVKSGICLRVFVPYTKEVSLGKLKAGTHKLTFLADDDTYFEKTLVIQ